MLLGTPARLPLDFAVLVVALLAGITTAAMLLPRLAR
jgi:ABC-2 type transport system permease protein